MVVGVAAVAGRGLPVPAVSGVVPGRSAVRAGVVAWVLLTGCVVVLAPLSWWDLTVGSTPVAGRAVIGDGPGGGPAIREVLVTSSPLFAWRWLWTLADGACVVSGRGRFGSSQFGKAGRLVGWSVGGSLEVGERERVDGFTGSVSVSLVAPPTVFAGAGVPARVAVELAADAVRGAVLVDEPPVASRLTRRAGGAGGEGHRVMMRCWVRTAPLVVVQRDTSSGARTLVL